MMEIPAPRSENDPATHLGRRCEYQPLWREVLGALLRDTRRRRAETLYEVAARAGVSPQYLSEIERGRKEASSEMIAAVSGALEMELMDLTSAITETLSSYASQRGTAGPQAAFALAA